MRGKTGVRGRGQGKERGVWKGRGKGRVNRL